MPVTIVAFLTEVHELMKLPSLEEAEQIGADE